MLITCVCSKYVLSVQVLGATWYVSSIQRQYECWRIMCKKEMNRTHSPSCDPSFFDCTTIFNHERQAWFRRTRVLTDCDALNDKNRFQFGMFADAFTDHVSSSRFFQKYFYCLWWGLKNLRFVFSLVVSPHFTYFHVMS